MIKTVLTKKNTTNNLLGVNPLFGHNLTPVKKLSKNQISLNRLSSNLAPL